MSIEKVRHRFIPWDYSSEKTKILLDGELRYFKDVESFILNPLSVVGNGIDAIEDLPFVEIINIETIVNISLENLRISGNKILVQNKNTSPVTVNLGTTGTPINYQIFPNFVYFFKFNGSVWIELIDVSCKYKVLDANYTILDNEDYDYYICYNNIIITMPNLASNLLKKPFYLVNADGEMKRYIGGGSDTINGFSAYIFNFKKGDFIKLIPTTLSWQIIDQTIFYDTGRVNTNNWVNRQLGNCQVDVDNLSTTIEIGYTVIGITSGATGKVIRIVDLGGGNYRLTLYEVTNGGIFLDNEIINFYNNSVILIGTGQVNQPTGDNKNIDTSMYLPEMSVKNNQIDKKLLIYTADNDNSSIELKPVTYDDYSTVGTPRTLGYSWFYAAINRLSMRTATHGLNYINNAGARIEINTQNWYYRNYWRVYY